MKTYVKMIRHSIAPLALFGALVVSGAQLTVTAQEAGKPKPNNCEKGDPFCKYVPPVKVKKAAASKPVPIPVPSIQERIEKYKAEKLAAMNAMRPAPKPTTAILLSEMQVTGIFRTPRGYAAMIEATPIKLSYVIYPGETFYDGQLVAIEEDRLVFRREIRFTDGHVDKMVENKPLRQPNAVMDSMTVSKAATESGNGAAVTAPADSPAEKAPTPQKQ
ncbi:MAG: hypothetical protein M3362_07665 [Acidobacteriota bacterium]|nr:hypothetical protein [Acidobacteriota bacterium]